MSLQISSDAEQDIEEIYLYSLANFGEKKADEYYTKLDNHLHSIVENPNFGQDFSFVKSGLRRSNYVSHAIYYLVSESGVLILRILHQRMDPVRHL